jgi:C4-dicarboxylate-specific signal transduction histidine kinase
MNRLLRSLDWLTVRTELGDSLPPIQGDRVQLQQVMLNLVINAIQAMSDVRDSKRELHVTTGVVESGESVRDAVRDTGPGPSAETSKVCFNDGMGVGLSICRSIIEDHRGRLWASRIEPQGALFQFTIPVLSRDMLADHDHARILKLYLLVRIHPRAQVSSQQQLCRVTS